MTMEKEKMRPIILDEAGSIANSVFEAIETLEEKKEDVLQTLEEKID